ncbi:MAG TPA: winged helix DNA-binding domain-containing protein [Streptosporangiaceae bacterium]|nr:winged helix DNA-binding domain-containing protein [Streptosporangiaceae bacterium]
MTSDVLGRRALNRALLARQLLLERRRMPAVAAIEHLAGMQAQHPTAPYVGLWTRLAGFEHAELARLLTERAVVRIALMRSTIHLVSARDCLALRPVIQPGLDRALKGTFGRSLDGVDMADLAATGRALVEERPRTFNELGESLAERWPGRDPLALAMAVRTSVPLAQLPPRGVWDAGGVAVHTTTESWLGRPLAGDTAPDEMVLRFLAAFGPATVMDAQTWSGLTRLREVIDRLRPRLRVFVTEDGKELFDLPTAPRPEPGVPAPVRLLPEYDNLLLSHADRTRVMCDAHRGRYMAERGPMRGSVLVDGFFRGLWKIERGRGRATVVVEPYERLTAADAEAVTAEAAALLTFAAAGAREHDVRFLPVR